MYTRYVQTFFFPLSPYYLFSFSAVVFVRVGTTCGVLGGYTGTEGLEALDTTVPRVFHLTQLATYLVPSSSVCV